MAAGTKRATNSTNKLDHLALDRNGMAHSDQIRSSAKATKAEKAKSAPIERVLLNGLRIACADHSAPANTNASDTSSKVESDDGIGCAA